MGYDPSRVTVAQIYLPIGCYTTWPKRLGLYERVREEVARELNVEQSTLSLIPTEPPPTRGMSTRIDADGLRTDDREVLGHAIASDYFVGTLLVSMVTATMIPASRAASIEPSIALRTE